MKRAGIFWLGLLWCGLGLAPIHAGEAQPLSLKQALDLAAQNHPQIAAAQLKALASAQAALQVRSAYYPNISANATAVGTGTDDKNTRVAAGGLNNPIIFPRNAEGLQVTQLLTDFGRTSNLSESSRLHTRAEETNALATREQITLQVTSAYFVAQEMQAVQEVAEQTVSTRKLLFDQVDVLAKNNLKSDLDVTFARVSLDESKLLLQKAGNDLNAAFEILSTLLGYRERHTFHLLEEAAPAIFSSQELELVNEALKHRPELVRLRLERDAAVKFARAEKYLSYPTISAVGVIGVIPVHDEHLSPNFAAAGVNLNVPLFNGGLYAARRSEADLQARRAEELVKDQENNVVRDVRIALQNVNYTRDRLELTAKLLESSALAYKLAEARYTQGASSIVELSQAQLNKTSAEITQTTAKYDYFIQCANLNFQIGALDGPAQPVKTQPAR